MALKCVMFELTAIALHTNARNRVIVSVHTVIAREQTIKHTVIISLLVLPRIYEILVFTGYLYAGVVPIKTHASSHVRSNQSTVFLDISGLPGPIFKSSAASRRPGQTEKGG